MNFPITITTSQPQSLKAARAVCFAWCLLPLCAFSQSAGSFDGEGAPIPPDGGSGSPKVPQAPQPVEAQPSRFAGTDVEPYVASRLAIFSMRNRAVDPFGLFQDPNMKPVIKQGPSRPQNKRQPALPPTPLVDIVKLIDITTIIPGERKFLVGTRSFQEGGEFPLEFRGKLLSMKILKVTASRIIFQDLKTGEKATRSTNVLPPGMVPGGEKMTPPGMVSQDSDSPLKLEASNSSPPRN